MKRIALAALVLIALAGGVAGQHDHTAHYGPAPVFSSLPPPPKMTGIGTATIKITTRSAEAQAWFDQGLNLMHAFWDMEAYRAFREATKADPTCAMAWWGIYNSLAQNAQENSEERANALKKAVELMPAASDREKHYIRAISLLAEQGKGRPAWIAEMEALFSKYPDEIEAKLLLANSLSSPASSYLPDGRPREGKMYGRAILENVIRTHPDNLAAHHYWIHAVENGPRPEEALASSEKLARMRPNSGHLIHMPGHIYYRLGMYEKARRSFVAALEFDLKYMRDNKIHPINNWNYTHNLDYLVANSAEEGRYGEAVKYARVLADIPSQADRQRSTGLGYMLYGGDTALVRLMMRYGSWTEAIVEVERSRPRQPGSLSTTYFAGLLGYLKGMDAVAHSDSAGAARALNDLQKASDELASARGQNASDWYSGHAGRVLAVHVLDLRGSVASLQGQHDEAVKLLTDAAERERGLGYWEPPHYTRPVLESLGAAFMRAGKYNDAAAAFERVLASRPNSGFAYAGMARAWKKAGDRARLTDSMNKLGAAWKNADPGLTSSLLAD